MPPTPPYPELQRQRGREVSLSLSLSLLALSLTHTALYISPSLPFSLALALLSPSQISSRSEGLLSVDFRVVKRSLPLVKPVIKRSRTCGQTFRIKR